jgi:hypothetical protein
VTSPTTNLTSTVTLRHKRTVPPAADLIVAAVVEEADAPVAVAVAAVEGVPAAEVVVAVEDAVDVPAVVAEAAVAPDTKLVNQ